MATLNDEQAREMNRAEKLNNYLQTEVNFNVWKDYLPFKIKVDAFVLNIEAVNKLVPDKEQTGKGVTTGKDDLKRKFADKAGVLFALTKDYAIEFNNTDLAAKVEMTGDDIYNLKDSEIIGLSKNINDNIINAALLGNADYIPYGVTAGMVADAVADAEAFDGLIGKSKSIDIGSDVANDEINKVQNDMRKQISSMLRLGNYFAVSNPSFVAGLKTASRKDDTGVRHTGAEVTVTINGVGTDKATVTIGKKQAKSDIMGECEPIYVTQGDKEVKCEVPGFATKTVIHHFIQGHMDKINFEF